MKLCKSPNIGGGGGICQWVLPSFPCGQYIKVVFVNQTPKFRIFISEKGPQLENCICRCICEIRVAYEYDWFNVYNASHAVEQFDDIPLGVDPEVCDFFDAEYCDELCFEEGDNFFYNTEFGQPHPRV